MSDIAPEGDFSSALMGGLGGEGAAPEGTPAQETTTAADTAVERPRNEFGQFVKQEPEGEAPAPTQDVDPAIDSFLAKYGGDVQKALRAAVEQQQLYGRQSGELGDLRQEVQYLRQLAEQQVLQQQQQPQPQPNWDSLLEDPGRATQIAFETGNAHMLQQAFDAWSEENPAAAWAWRGDRMAEVQRQQIMQEIDSRLGPVVQQTAEQQFQQALGALARQYPDMDSMAPAMAQIAQERPHLLDGLQNGSPQARATVLEDLYHLARSRSAPQFAAAVAQAQAEQAAASEQAKQEAFVASGTTSAQGMAQEPPLTPDQVLSQNLGRRMARANINDGWDQPPPGWQH